jgi:hypothetical protein
LRHLTLSFMQLLSVTATVSVVFVGIVYTQLRVISSIEGVAGICLLQTTARAATALSQVSFCDPEAFNWSGCEGSILVGQRTKRVTPEPALNSAASVLVARSST